MKDTLRKRIKDMVTRIKYRIFILEDHVKEYKQDKRFESAMKSDIKKRTLEMILIDLKKQLEG